MNVVCIELKPLVAVLMLANIPLRQNQKLMLFVCFFIVAEELTVTLKSEVFKSGSSFNCSLSNYNGQVMVLNFQLGDNVLSCNLDPAVPCSFQDNVTGIHATDFNPITNSFSVTIENITSYNGTSALCSAASALANFNSNQIDIFVPEPLPGTYI